MLSTWKKNSNQTLVKRVLRPEELPPGGKLLYREDERLEREARIETEVSVKLIYGKGLLEIAGCGPLALEPMALALSRIYRWSGHSPITVAQHAVMTSYLCPAYPREALLHDASEAFIGDIPAPLKQAFPELQAFESDMLERIFRGFGLRWPIPPAVKGVDRRLLATEARQFLGLDYPEPYGMKIQPWNSAKSQRRLLERAEEVGLYPRENKKGGSHDPDRRPGAAQRGSA